MPRVLFVAPSAYPLGGVAVWLEYLVRGLQVYGWEPTVALVGGRWHDPERYVETYPDLPSITVENPTGSAEGRRRALVAAIRQHAPDIVVGVNIADVYSACRSLRRESTHSSRVVMALHGIAADLLGDLEWERDVIDGVIVTNRLTGVLCHELAGIEAERVYYAPYGVDIEAMATFQHERLGSGPFRIAYVGRIDEDQKGIRTIPEILFALDEYNVDYRLDVVGDGPEKDWLHDALAPWTTAGRATILGPVPPSAIGQQVYGQADAVLVTSSWETGPIVIWEAMAAGVPVVTSRYIGSGLEGALKHSKNCLMFPVGDAREAARQLRVLTDANTARKLATKARELVIARYSIDSSVKEWAEAFRNVLDAAPVTTGVRLIPPRIAGRLDRLLGTELAESFRRSLGRSFTHQSAGGEWPHTLGYSVGGDSFLEIAAQSDKL